MREDNFKMTQPENKRRIGRRTVVGCLVGALLLGLVMVAVPTPSFARVRVGIFVNFGPPALPIYEQPPCPGPGYMWTPGYWAWDPAYGYYWVPGTWVPAPFLGAMWTPGYWDFDDGGYRWRPGYWGFSVGYYGGVNYGFGYTSYGYFGGYWNHNRFYYNRAVNNVRNTYITHVYYRHLNDRFRDRRTSYHGGRDGMHIRPTREQRAAERHRRFGPVRQQLRQMRFARSNPAQRARRNHGRPEFAATRRPGEFRHFGRENRPGGAHRAPVERRGGRQFSRTEQGRTRNDRGFQSFSHNRSERPNTRRENRAPVQRTNERPVYRNNSQRMSERPTYRNNSRNTYQQRSQYQAHPQQQVRRVESRPAQRRPERQVNTNNSPRNFQRAQRQSPPQETRRVESRPAQAQHSSAQRQAEHGGGRGNGHGNEHGNGHGGRR